MKLFINWCSKFSYLFPDWYTHETRFACNEELRHRGVKLTFDKCGMGRNLVIFSCFQLYKQILTKNGFWEWSELFFESFPKIDSKSNSVLGDRETWSQRPQIREDIILKPFLKSVEWGEIWWFSAFFSCISNSLLKMASEGGQNVFRKLAKFDSKSNSALATPEISSFCFQIREESF